MFRPFNFHYLHFVGIFWNYERDNALICEIKDWGVRVLSFLYAGSVNLERSGERLKINCQTTCENNKEWNDTQEAADDWRLFIATIILHKIVRHAFLCSSWHGSRKSLFVHKRTQRIVYSYRYITKQCFSFNSKSKTVFCILEKI